ncbi:unnamed protein product [Protopolystoma xenopodis]|uniref:Uncharacterized protein n=1 Tax=Protopolystoma xenopodis TaxID=117903 RepID=A0A448X3V9_9PLAT|nr:unnamed protein product [Protopolystoma xenopodis]
MKEKQSELVGRWRAFSIGPSAGDNSPTIWPISDWTADLPSPHPLNTSQKWTASRIARFHWLHISPRSLCHGH